MADTSDSNIKWEKLDPSVAPTSLTLESLTPQQKSLLDQFKTALKSELRPVDHDLELVKWLIARQWSLPAALEMYRKSMKWRAHVGADHILEEFPKSPYFKFLCENYPTNHTDTKCPKILRIRDGSHFCIENMGSLSAEAAALVPSEEIIKYHIYSMELADKVRRDILKELGYKEMQQSFVVEDLGEIGTSHLSMASLLKVFTQIDSDNYPETLRKVVIVNVPSMFSFIWSAVQYFWDENQKKKFQFVQSGENHVAVLTKAVDPSFLPKAYGGTMDYDLPKGDIVQMKKELAAIPAKKYANTDFVPRSGKLEKVVVAEEGSIIHYEFKTIDYDVSFGVHYKKSEVSQVEEHWAVQRVDSHQIPVFGRFKVEKAGHYVLLWDNTASWTRGKDLHFTINIVND